MRMFTEAVIAVRQPLILHLGQVLRKMSDSEFFEMCQMNAVDVENPGSISGDPFLPGFELDLRQLWG